MQCRAWQLQLLLLINVSLAFQLGRLVYLHTQSPLATALRSQLARKHVPVDYARSQGRSTRRSVQTTDRRSHCRFDLDLSSKPYKVMKYHEQAVKGVTFHRKYPLFASGSDDATAQVFHGMVYSDLMTNPLIVPVKIIRGHAVHDFTGVLDVAFHPTQPWLFTAGGDGRACLYVD